jgi:hypothetical protein
MFNDIVTSFDLCMLTYICRKFFPPLLIVHNSSWNQYCTKHLNTNLQNEIATFTCNINHDVMY